MRLLHLIPNLLSGGAQQQLSYLAGEQAKAGHDVNVAYVTSGPKRSLFERPDVRLHVLSARGNHDPGLVVNVVRLIRRTDPDVVQTWLLQMDVLGGVSRLVEDRCWVMTERASAPLYDGTVKGWARARLARRADAVVSNSGAGDAYWKGRVPDAVRHVIPNAVPVGRIDAEPPVPATRLGLPEGNHVVLYAGRFEPQKNLEVLIPALARLTGRSRSTAYLCGDGVNEREARDLVSALPPPADVRFVGYVPDVWGWMKRADVFVSVSHFEGHPNTVLEAAACGCPLVLSDIPEHREMLGDAEAVFVDRTSPESVARALESVLADRAAARRRADAARSAVAAFSAERMAGRYESLYAEILARRASRRRG